MKMLFIIRLLRVVNYEWRKMQGGKLSKKKDGSHGLLAVQNHYLLGILT